MMMIIIVVVDDNGADDDDDDDDKNDPATKTKDSRYYLQFYQLFFTFKILIFINIII